MTTSTNSIDHLHRDRRIRSERLAVGSDSLGVTADASAAATLGDRVEDLVVRATRRRSRSIRVAGRMRPATGWYTICPPGSCANGGWAEDALQGALVTACSTSSRRFATRPASARAGLVAAGARPRLLRRGQASPVVGSERQGPAGRRAGRSRRPDLGRRARRARSRLPARVGRASGGLRPAPPPGLSLEAEIAETLGIPAGTARSRLPFAAPGFCARPSRPTRHRSSPRDGWHDRRAELRSTRSSLARPDAGRGARPGRSSPSSRPSRRRRRCGGRGDGWPWRDPIRCTEHSNRSGSARRR